MTPQEVGLTERKIAIVVHREALEAVSVAERLLGSFSVTQLPIGTPREARESAETINAIHLDCLSTPNSGQMGDPGLLGRSLHVNRLDFVALIIRPDQGTDLGSFWNVAESEFGAPIVAGTEFSK